MHTCTHAHTCAHANGACSNSRGVKRSHRMVQTPASTEMNSTDTTCDRPGASLCSSPTPYILPRSPGTSKLGAALPVGLKPEGIALHTGWYPGARQPLLGLHQQLPALMEAVLPPRLPPLPPLQGHLTAHLPTWQCCLR